MAMIATGTSSGDILAGCFKHSGKKSKTMSTTMNVGASYGHILVEYQTT